MTAAQVAGFVSAMLAQMAQMTDDTAAQVSGVASAMLVQVAPWQMRQSHRGSGHRCDTWDSVSDDSGRGAQMHKWLGWQVRQLHQWVRS